MKAYFLTEDFPDCGSEMICAFVDRAVAEEYLNKKSYAKHKREDDPSYAIVDVETEGDFVDKIYAVVSIREGYDYDGIIIFYDETLYGAFADMQNARKFLFHQFDEKPDVRACLGLKEFPIITCNEEFFSKNCKELFRCDYQV